MDSNSEIVRESLPYYRLYKDGHVERLIGEDFVAPSIDPQTGVSSKDVLIKPDGTVSARLFLPTLTQNSVKLPILIYFHGGGFILESPTSPTYHNYINYVVSKANVVAISIQYRRAPEHPIPIPYDDSWAALQWVASHADGSREDPEFWLTKHADFRRLFLSGDSAGANIAHNMAVRAGLDGLNHGVTIHGVALVHPYFWGSKTIGSEGVNPMKVRIDKLWSFVCGTSSDNADNDNPLINPLAPNAPSLSGLGCSQMLVCVAEKDILRDRGHLYYETLSKSGWGGIAEMLESKGEDHVFHFFNPSSENAHILMERLLSFFNNKKQ